jgi:hypothetical protein
MARREFRQITEAAGLGVGWAPRDLRHTFVSLMSADGVPIEEIARLAGHNRTATTELVYRHELRPVITTGAEVWTGCQRYRAGAGRAVRPSRARRGAGRRRAACAAGSLEEDRGPGRQDARGAHRCQRRSGGQCPSSCRDRSLRSGARGLQQRGRGQPCRPVVRPALRTSVLQADRNWPQSLGKVPPRGATTEVILPHFQRAVDEGMAPAAVADLVADGIAANRFWVFTDPRFTQLALDRWQRIAKGHNPQTEVDAPGLPPAKQITAEIQRLLAGPGGALWLPGGPGPRLDGTT